MTPPGLPPGPSAPALCQALRLSRDPIATLTDARERYGDVFTLRLWRVGEQVVVAAPAALGALLAAACFPSCRPVRHWARTGTPTAWRGLGSCPS